MSSHGLHAGTPSDIDGIQINHRDGDWVRITSYRADDKPFHTMELELGHLRERSITGPVNKITALSVDSETPSGQIAVVGTEPTALFQTALQIEEGSRWLVEFPDGYRMPEQDATPAGSLFWDASEPVPRRPNLRIWSLTDAVGQGLIEFRGIRIAFLVLPRKLPSPGRLDKLESLLRSVWTRHYPLLRRLGRPSSISVTDRGAYERAPIQTLMLLHQLVWHGGLHESWEAIAAEPNALLDIDWPTTDIHRASRPVLHGARGPWTLADGWIPGQPTGRVRTRVPQWTVDTPPNRLAMRLALTVDQAATDILHLLDSTDRPAAEGWRKISEELKQRTQRFCAVPALRDVNPYGPLGLDSTLVQMNATYQPLVRAWAALQEGVDLASDAEPMFEDPLKEAWDLYEYWCWFTLCELMEKVLNKGGNGRIVKTKQEDPLGDGQKLRNSLVYVIKAAVKTDVTAVVHYNAPAGKSSPYDSYSRRFRPDLALELSIASGPKTLVIFDAKYRVLQVHRDDKEQDEEKRGEKRGIAKTDDLKVMHAYRDALRSKVSKKKAIWVLTLFPGSDAVFYPASGERGPLKGLDTVQKRNGIGAVPVAPGALGDLKKVLEHLVERCAARAEGAGSGTRR